MLGLCLAPSPAVMAQTGAMAPLPPAAREALDKGIIAAKVPDYLLAIRFFEDARKAAPDASVVYLNLGLAESRIPTRELRAMAWFGAYLAASPNAANAAAVKTEIEALSVRSQSTASRLIKAAQDAAGSAEWSSTEKVARLWAEIGDIKAAIKFAERYSSRISRFSAYREISSAQSSHGDIPGARVTAELIQDADTKSGVLVDIANSQIRFGDTVGAGSTLASALMTADLIKAASAKCDTLIKIAEAQVKIGDDASAQKTIASAPKYVESGRWGEIQRAQIAMVKGTSGDFNGALGSAALLEGARGLNGPTWKSVAYLTIVEAQAKRGDIAGAQRTADLFQPAETHYKSIAQTEIVAAQIKVRDFAGAQKTADSIPDSSYKKPAQRQIADAQAKDGTTSAPVPPPTQPGVKVSDWLTKLDRRDYSNSGGLNIEPILDLPGHLKSLPPSDDPETYFKRLLAVATEIVSAQGDVAKTLKQQFQK